MKSYATIAFITLSILVLVGLDAFQQPIQAASPTGNPAPAATDGSSSPKHQTVKKYLDGCRVTPPKEANCDTLRKDVIQIVKEDLHTLGSSADRTYLLSILPMFKSPEVELRIAAADAIGMIGPQDQDIDLLAPLTNDPVPDVRTAVGQMIQRGKGAALALLGQRTASVRTGRTPETAPDTNTFRMPVAPESTYLFYASDPAFGRLSYAAKGMSEATAFYKGKAKRGPLKLDEFQEKYQDQLEDEQQAMDAVSEEHVKQSAKGMDSIKPDPANMAAYLEKIQQIQAVNMNNTMAIMANLYQPELYGSPTVYILEERQIGSRTYPTRYVVLYQDLTLKRPGFRLCWMTVSDQAIKSFQTASTINRKREEAQQKEEESRSMIKEKSEQEKKKFKKGQSDLEKELGF